MGSIATNEPALVVFEKLLLYGYKDEKLAWKAANKYPALDTINQAIGYIEKEQHRNLDQIYSTYFQLLLKTRICILEEHGKCSLIDDESIASKERIICCREWIETNIVKVLISEWYSLYDKLLQTQVEWKGYDVSQIIANMIKMSKTVIDRLKSFQDVQNTIVEQLDHAIDHKSRRMMNIALNDINNCLDSYIEKGESVLMEATKNYNYSQRISESKTDDDENSLFSMFWSIFMHLSLKFDENKLEKIIEKENDTVYWLLLFSTRSKIKILMIKCVLRRKNIMNFLNDSMKNKNEFLEGLFTFDSTICSYTGLREWSTMSSMIGISKIMMQYQNDLKNTQETISEKIQETEKCKTKETLNKLLVEINTNLDAYIQNGQDVLKLIENASEQWHI